MLKDFFNWPLNPFRDKREPTFLTVGDFAGSVLVAAAVTGSAYALVLNRDEIQEYLNPTANSAGVPETAAPTAPFPT